MLRFAEILCHWVVNPENCSSATLCSDLLLGLCKPWCWRRCLLQPSALNIKSNEDCQNAIPICIRLASIAKKTGLRGQEDPPEEPQPVLQAPFSLIKRASMTRPSVDLPPPEQPLGEANEEGQKEELFRSTKGPPGGEPRETSPRRGQGAREELFRSAKKVSGDAPAPGRKAAAAPEAESNPGGSREALKAGRPAGNSTRVAGNGEGEADIQPGRGEGKPTKAGGTPASAQLPIERVGTSTATPVGVGEQEEERQRAELLKPRPKAAVKQTTKEASKGDLTKGVLGEAGGAAAAGTVKAAVGTGGGRQPGSGGLVRGLPAEKKVERESLDIEFNSATLDIPSRAGVEGYPSGSRATGD